VESFKRGPGFRSWGGKRSELEEDQENYDSAPKWEWKRRPFQSWGGKRAPTSLGAFKKVLNYGEKRRFSSWGGKRSL